MATTLSSYQLVAGNLSKWQSMTAKSPDVAQQTKYYQANIGNVKSAKDLIKNYRLFNYVMTSFGLSSMASYGKGLIQKVLEQGVGNSKNLAYTLKDSRILELAKTFDFVSNGEKTTSSSAVQTDVVNNYLRQALESNQGQLNPGVQMALHFERSAPNITTAYQILADKDLLSVVQTALGLSKYMSMEDIDKQANTLSKLINFKDFQDPKKLHNFIQRFAAQYDIANSDGSTTGSISSSLAGTNAILAGASSGSTIGISSSVLASLSSLRLGGA
jgi:hypothetical protein